MDRMRNFILNFNAVMISWVIYISLCAKSLVYNKQSILSEYAVNKSVYLWKNFTTNFSHLKSLSYITWNLEVERWIAGVIYSYTSLDGHLFENFEKLWLWEWSKGFLEKEQYSSLAFVKIKQWFWFVFLGEVQLLFEIQMKRLQGWSHQVVARISQKSWSSDLLWKSLKTSIST